MASQTSARFYQAALAESQTIVLTWTTFLTHVLPPVVCHYEMAVLVQLDGTRIYRLALVPLMFWLAWRAISVDMSRGDPTEIQLHSGFITQMCSMSLRSTIWALSRVRYQRHSPSTGQKTSDSTTVYTACWNAWDLMVNNRGIGWNWPRGFVPKPSKTDSRLAFVLWATVKAVIYGVALDACLQSVRALSPETFGSLKGGTLFDQSLPPVLELLRAAFVSLALALCTFFLLQFNYNSAAVVFIVLFQQHPSQWPPLFDSPFSSTSLGELWGRRWHQLMRDMALSLGAQPLNHVFGRLGGVLGAFVFSGVFHDVELHTVGRGGNTLTMLVFWTMNGVGVVLERAWKRATGRSVGGVWGWLWMAGWLLFWSLPMVDEYAKVGRFGARTTLGRFEPSLLLVRAFSGWLQDV